MIFSKPFGFLEKGYDIEDALQHGLDFAAYVAILPYFPWLMKLLVSPLISSLKLMPYNFIVDKSVQALDERRGNPDARYDYVAHWLKAHQKYPEKLTAKHVQAAVTSNIRYEVIRSLRSKKHANIGKSAGADTVSCALQSFIYHTIRHPQVWQRLRAEIESAMQQGLCQSQVISFADSQKLVYLQACIKENLRFFVPATLGFQREAPVGGITIGDRTFPAGIMLSVYGPSILLSKEIWGSDAREFKPERWLDESIVAKEKYFMPVRLHRRPLAMLTFPLTCDDSLGWDTRLAWVKTSPRSSYPRFSQP